MKKILIINTVGFFANGITSVILNYYRNMRDSGLQFEFLSAGMIEKEIQEEFRRDGVNFYSLKRKESPIHYMVSLYRLCRKQNYDAVHVHGNSGTMVLDLLPAKFAGVKMRIAHGHNTRCDHMRLHKLLRIGMNLLCTERLACSKQAGIFAFGKKKEFYVLNNAIALEEYRYDVEMRTKYRKKFGILENEYVIGHVGNFCEQKNHKFLIDVFAQIHKEYPTTKLLLVGNGSLLDEIKEKVEMQNLQDSVIFAGQRSDMPALYQMMDVFVLPSLWEGLGLVLIEAQASGLPCIASTAVPNMADVCGTISYIPMESKVDWVGKLKYLRQRQNVKRENCADINIFALRKEKFDISVETEILKKLYYDQLF